MTIEENIDTYRSKASSQMIKSAKKTQSRYQDDEQDEVSSNEYEYDQDVIINAKEQVIINSNKSDEKKTESNKYQKTEKSFNENEQVQEIIKRESIP